MRGWVILVVTLLVGVVLGLALASQGPGILASYLPKPMRGATQRIDGEVLRKQRDGNRLLLKVSTPQGPMLVVFTQKVAELEVLLDPGDLVTLGTTAGYATFVDDPVLESVKRPGRPETPAAPAPAQPPATPAPAR